MPHTGEPGDERLGAVDRVDDPAVPPGGAGRAPLLADDLVVAELVVEPARNRSSMPRSASVTGS